MNKGLGSKIHLLHSTPALVFPVKADCDLAHANIPFELKALNLQSTTFSDLFIDQRGGTAVGSSSQRTKSELVIPAGPFANKKAPSLADSPLLPPTAPRSPMKEAGKKPSNYKTVPCALYHLDKCKFGSACTFSHEPISVEAKADLAKKWAGKFGQTGQEREKGDDGSSHSALLVCA